MRRRRRNFFDEIMAEMDEMLRQMMEEMQNGPREFRPFVYGFSMSQRPGEEPEIREFGNIQPDYEGRRVDMARRPLVDVFESDDKVHVIAEMPGVEKEDINVEYIEGGLLISGQRGDQRYEEKVELPCPVDPESAEATYRNGVLEVTLQIQKKAPSGKKIGVK